MRYYHWDDLKAVSARDHSLRKLVAGQHLTIARTETEMGSSMRRRCFPQETFIVILVGLWRVRAEGREIMLGANEVLSLPAFVEHDVEALDDTLALEILAQPNAACFEALEPPPLSEDENYLWGV